MTFIKYKLSKDALTSEVAVVNKIYSDHTLSIPFDPVNTDYQEFLQWKADGGVPEKAD